jgi:hypothetical protein
VYLLNLSGGGEKVKKKLLGIFCIFFVVALLTIPLVSAKPTSAANNSKAVSFMWHSENGASIPGELKINPSWAEIVDPGPPPVIPDAKVTHTIASWALNPEGDNYIQIGDGAQIQINAETGYEATLYVQSQYRTPTHMLMNYRVYEKIMWGDGNYIEIKCLERANLEILAEPPYFSFYASGTFSGQGVIDGQKVQVTGIREGSQQAVGFVLECYGTIRFAGNTD